MPRYDRIPARIESSRDSDVHSPGTVERRMFPTEETKSRRKRLGSLTPTRSQSSGSYASVESNEEDFLSNQDKYDDSNTEKPPLRNQSRNYASDDYDGPAGHNGLPSDEAATFPSRSISPRAIYPSTTACHSNSFDLDDDDDDDDNILEANLKRYNLDFSATDKAASLADGTVNDGNPFGSRGTSNSNRCTKATRYLWFSFQSVRQQARQRRAQLLLQQTERNWRQSLKICVITNCDATDSGILLVAATMVFWILFLILVKNSTVRRGGIVAGILFFIIRVGTRPLYHFFIQKLQKRQLHHQQRGESSQTSPGSKTRHSDDQHHRHHLAHSNGTLELHAIRSDSSNANGSPLATSVGSDPTVAAI
jgi:hypothetical protein